MNSRRFNRSNCIQSPPARAGLQDTELARIMTVPLARNEAGRQGGAEANGRSALKAPKSVRAAEKFSRTRLSQSFFMRDFLFSEIAAIEGLSNLPDDPELAIAAGRGLCENLLEPLQATFGRIAIRSAYRSPEVNDFGCRHRLSCASNVYLGSPKQRRPHGRADDDRCALVGRSNGHDELASNGMVDS